MTIGFIGLGGMGRNMAANLLRAGEPLVVWNRSAEPVDELVTRGARRAEHPAEAGNADVVFSMLADDAATRSVLLDGGVIGAMPPGSVYVNMATVSVAFAREMAALFGQRGLGYVAAPVLGRVDVAAAGKLNILAAGDDALIARVQPYFDLMGQKTWRFGDQPQRANAAKLAANLALACAIEAMGESSALARTHGIAAADFLDMLSQTLFAGAPVYQGYGTLIAHERYSPAGFKLALGMKDVRLALDAAKENNLPLAFGDVVHQNLQDAVQHGDAGLDLAALAKVVARRGGLE
jgi:3-hydroxyisobutyrate dehydrogenase-like beta-hydroxyacid dehydrogenase